MALIAPVTVGFEIIGNLYSQPDSPRLYEMTPGLVATEGDLLVSTLNRVALAAAGAVRIVGVAAETRTAHATLQTFVRVHDNPANVYRCTFGNHRDAVATGAGTTTTLVDGGLAATPNAYIGGTIHFYQGPGAGETRIISAYDSTGRVLTWQAPLAAATTLATRYILIGAALANEGIGQGTIGVNLLNARTISASATIAAEAGPLAVYSVNPAGLTMDVVVRRHYLNV